MTELEVVQRVAESRLVEMGLQVVPLTADGLAERFSRTTAYPGALHYLIELGGCACAFSLWRVADRPSQDPHRQILDAEIGELREAGRIRFNGLHLLGPGFCIVSEVLAPEDPGQVARGTLEVAFARFIEGYWNRDTVARLTLTAATSAAGGSGPAVSDEEKGDG